MKPIILTLIFLVTLACSSTSSITPEEAKSLGWSGEDEPCSNKDNYPGLYSGVAWESIGDGWCRFYYPPDK